VGRPAAAGASGCTTGNAEPPEASASDGADAPGTSLSGQGQSSNPVAITIRIAVTIRNAS
jgi:hypothetical protein